MLKGVMPGRKNDGVRPPSTNYEIVSAEDLGKTRRGKHHDLMAKIMADLKVVGHGSAIKIPLKEVKNVSVPKLRAAITRASAAKGVKISTSSDPENFYVWRQGR
jgi:hypothetical protein